MLPESVRRAWIDHFMRLVMRREAAFAEAIAGELDRSPWETFTEEIEPLMAACRWHRRHGLALLRPRRLRRRPWWLFGQSHWRLRVPRGRVAIIATWNYPVQLLGVQLVQAITAGNDVVVKPSERSPRSQALLLECAMEAAERAGAPRGMIRAVEATRDAGSALLESGDGPAAAPFDFVIFTGSTDVGRLVARRCAETLTPSALELSGRDSAIVLDDADTALAARTLWHALTMNGGQTCMAPRRVLVTRAAYRGFVAALAPLAAAARPRRLISDEAAERAFALARGAVERGGRSASGVLEGPQPSARPARPESAPVAAERTIADRRSLRPLAIVDCPEDAPLVDGEHFGPVMAVVPVADERDAVDLHRRCPQRLATSIYTGDPRRWRDPARLAELGSGVVTINDTIIPTGHPGASISGVGESGWSATRGEAGLQALTREVILSVTRRRLRVPIEPPAAAGQRVLRRIARRLAGANRGEKA